MATSTNSCVYKLLMIGDSSVGKTCITVRFADDTFDSAYHTSLGVDFKVRNVDLDGKQVTLQIWDTAGQEKFRAITAPYYRGAMGIVLVYDITNETSFQHVENWMRKIEENASPNVQKIIVGNKCDLQQSRKISKQMGEALANRYKVPFFETSAKTGFNIDDVFISLARAIKSKLDDREAGVNGPHSRGIAVGHSPSTQTGQVGANGKKLTCCGY